MDSFSVALYAASMIANGITFMGLRIAIARLLRSTGRLEQEDTAVEQKHWLSVLIYLIAMLIAFYHPRVALGMIGLVTLIWITPTAGVKPHKDTYPRNT
jgi:uncharacterized membrane protein